MRRLLVFALVAVLCIATIVPVTHAQAATGNTYYVANNGNDSNPGTLSQPWRTITKAASTAAAGDTVYITPGMYRENVTFTRSGSPDAQITFSGKNPPTIVSATKSSAYTCLNSNNACVIGILTVEGSQVILKNLEIVGPSPDPGELAGINVKGTFDQVISNYTHNTWKEGIALRDTSQATVVMNNTITYAVVSGIWFDGLYQFIYGNTITHTVTRPPDGSSLSTDTDADGIRFFGKYSTVRANIIKDIFVEESPASDYPHSDCFQSWRDAVDITFEANYCELANSQASLPMQKFFMIERGSGANIGDFDIVSNIFVSKSSRQSWTPIQIGSDSCSTISPLLDITIANNTFVRTGSIPGDTAILMRCTNTAEIKNNTFYNFGNESSSYILQDKNNNINVTIEKNAVYNVNGEVPEGGPYPGDNIASLWMNNPLFVNATGGDYHLQSDSPLIDAGADMSGVVVRDFSGATWSEGMPYDIGAYEYRQPLTISGNVGDSGVTLAYYDGGTKRVTSDANGDYSLKVSYHWSGTITPSKVYETFIPTKKNYSSMTSNQSDQDYTFSVSSFADVPTTHWAWSFIEQIYASKITSGCGINPLVFCPDRAVTRAEIAVFILRAKDGLETPNPVDTNIFADVPVVGKEWMQPWIEEFYLQKITSGCSTDPLQFCPERKVTRAEVAVFFLRAKYGKDYEPPAVDSSSFADVPVTGKKWMMPWIEEFYKEGMTTGCKQSPSLQYCPEQSVTRAQMAVYIDRVFGPFGQ